MFKLVSNRQSSLDYLLKLKQLYKTTSCLIATSSTHFGANTQEARINITKPCKNVAHLEIFDPKTKNAFSQQQFDAYNSELLKLENDSSVRCIVLSGHGSDFTSGINVKELGVLIQQINDIKDQARKSKHLKNLINNTQQSFILMRDVVTKPIIACIHGLCLGMGMELVAAADIRYCSQDSKMSIREVKLGFAADVGSLQLLPKLFSNQSLLREYIYTGKMIPVDEAIEAGFVSRKFENKEKTIQASLELAEQIAKISPVATQGSKINLRYSENKSFRDGLDYNAIWNMSMMRGEDVLKALMAVVTKEEAEFEDF